ncbi:MAG: translation elongation factor Ts [Bacteroidales bacterium]|jgi:elongation factor Ts|nr:translation elongation factor Ts [Bacteroidales bacterium]
MANITAAEVNNLRKITGAGMMDCKKALIESEGDVEKAIDILRKKGQKIAAKRADKSASEGVVLSGTNEEGTFAAVVMINCETDFVAKNQDFIDFTKSVLDVAIANKAKNADELNGLDLDGHSVADSISDQMGKIGEQIKLGAYEMIEAPKTFAYIHQGNRLATVLGLNMADGVDQIGHELAMQVAAMAPVAVDKDDVDQAIIDKEMEIGMDQARQEGKPEEMLEKIATGKVNKFLKENTLLNQVFVRDGKKIVRDYLKETNADLTVTGFKRVMLGA